VNEEPTKRIMLNTDSEVSPDGAALVQGRRARRRSRAASAGPRSPGRVVVEYTVLALFALALASMIRAFLGLAFYIPSESMVPTLEKNDRVIVSRLSYLRGDIKRADIIVFRNPKYDGDKPSNVVERALSNAMEVVGVGQPRDKFFIKRVIGLPGDKIEGKENAVFINGKLLDEPWLPKNVQIDTFAEETVPKGEYFMMGDNRTNSSDSRYGLGTIKKSAVVGEAVVRIWPPSRMGGLDVFRQPDDNAPEPTAEATPIVPSTSPAVDPATP
jgi:signal peptidase I